MASETRTCQNCKQQFTIEPEDFQFYEKIKVPAPTWCPECRLIRRLTWRNERSLYRRNCDKCGKSIISVFPKDSGLIVYCKACWWQDDWDGMKFGVSFNPNLPFLIQLRELLNRVPVPALFGLEKTLENSEYTNMTSYLKNCYFVTHSDHSENCSYGSMMVDSKDSIDNLLLYESELCYETVNCRKSYQTFFSLDCESCHKVMFCKNCVGCSDCIGCVNLRNKKFHIFNQSYSKDEYEKLAKNFRPISSLMIEGIKSRAYAHWNKFPQKYIHEKHNSSVSGDYLYNSKNVHQTFMGVDTEDSKFCAFITPPRVTNCYDFTHYGNVADLLYETLQAGDHVSKILFSWFAVSNELNVEYSIFTVGCQNIFGSISIKKREYCILNKQYAKEEYEKIRREIIKQMSDMPYRDKRGNIYRYGEFFPLEMSPFGYNATTAQELFPISETEARENGYSWKNQERYEYKITMSKETIPDKAEEVSDSILNEIIECAHAGKCVEQCSIAFKITANELAFYKKMNLPLPRLCPNCRHYQRLKQRNPFKLWHRQCQCAGEKSENGIYQNTISHFHGAGKCPNEFETSYAPERKEIVYCEQCYNAEVV